MAPTALRPSLIRRVRSRDVESLATLHATLVRERQELRSSSASLPELERNRLAIVRCQWELSQALIARHLVPATAA